jgi:hypothetical protein
MKRLFLWILLSVVSLPWASQATDAFFINSGNIIGEPPQIDATNFVNEAGGVINISTPTPFEPFDTSNTENFTNKGTMSCLIGWQFDTAPSGNGLRRPAKNFRNHPSGTITALDGGVEVVQAGVPIFFGSKLLVSATNLINEGGALLNIDSLGLMDLRGKNVNLNRGRLQVLPLNGLGIPPDFLETPTNFIPDSGIIDNYWGIVTNNINSATILVGGGSGAISPIHQVQQAVPGLGYLIFLTQVSANPATSFVFTNASPPAAIIVTNVDPVTTNIYVTNFFLSTNVTIQGAFVQQSGSIGIDARFFPSTSVSNLFSTITVRMATSVPNPVTGLSDTRELYLMDRLASETNRQLQANLAVTPTTFKPSPYGVGRTAPNQYLSGSFPNSVVRPNLFFDSATMSNATVISPQIGYSAKADIVGQRPAAVPGGAISNIAGRVTINAETLDLTRTRLRADSWVNIKGTHLVGSSNAVMDAPLISYDLGSTNGTLRIINLASASLPRFGGDIYAWSGVWTNAMRVVITNYAIIVTNIPDPIVPTNMIPVTNVVRADLTNFVNIGFHALILNASALSTAVSGRVHDLVTHSTNLFVNDPVVVTNTFFTDAERLTIDGLGAGIVFDIALQNWGSVNAPNLRYLTNMGTLSVPNEAHFGDDRPVPYAAFVNKGSAYGFAAGINIRSDYFENSGSLETTSLLDVQTVSGRMEVGNTFTGGDLRIAAYDLRLREYFHYSQGAMVFIITNSLYDNGPTAGVQMLCDSGFDVFFANATGKPQVGDLLGTTFDTLVPDFLSIPHAWPGDDRGVSASGFANNLALGQLVISVGFLSQAIFSGTGANNGLYVDYLTFFGVSLDDLEDAIAIDPNLIIYFADSNLSPEQLDGRLGGHLRWVSSFAGPNSSVTVVPPAGPPYQMNRALRESLTIDSDGDGLANGYDPSPLDPTISMSVSVASVSPLTLAVSWNAKAQTVYDVQFRTNQVAPWQLLKRYTNNAPTNGTVTILDQVPSGGPQRYYRVGYNP